MTANQGYERAWSSVSGWIGQWGCGGMSLESVGSLTWNGRCCLKFIKDCQKWPESSCWCISCLWLRKCGWEVMDRWEVVNRTIDQKSNPWHLVSILGCISLLLCLVGIAFFFFKRVSWFRTISWSFGARLWVPQTSGWLLQGLNTFGRHGPEKSVNALRSKRGVRVYHWVAAL